MKRDKYDTVFSNLVRARAGWTCQRCGKMPTRQGLDCSHVFGRRKNSVRWDFDNAFALCTGCHREFTSQPHEHHAWVRVRIGETRYAALSLRAGGVKKWKPAEKEQLYADMKVEWKTFVKRGMD